MTASRTRVKWLCAAAAALLVACQSTPQQPVSPTIARVASLESLATSVSAQENRAVSFTNKRSAFYYTQTHRNDPHAAPEPERPVEVLDGLAPGGSCRSVLERLEACGPNDVIVLVGHEPDLGKLAGTLLFGAPATGLPLKKAGACAIHFVGPRRAGEGRLGAFLPPRVLRRLARKASD